MNRPTDPALFLHHELAKIASLGTTRAPSGALSSEPATNGGGYAQTPALKEFLDRLAEHDRRHREWLASPERRASLEWLEANAPDLLKEARERAKRPPLVKFDNGEADYDGDMGREDADNTEANR